LQHYSQHLSFGISPDALEWVMKMHNEVLFIHKEEWNYVVCRLEVEDHHVSKGIQVQENKGHIFPLICRI
jgi:hypothetical protein